MSMTIEDLAEEMRAGFARITEQVSGLSRKVDALSTKYDVIYRKLDRLSIDTTSAFPDLAEYLGSKIDINAEQVKDAVRDHKHDKYGNVTFAA